MHVVSVIQCLASIGRKKLELRKTIETAVIWSTWAKEDSGKSVISLERRENAMFMNRKINRARQ